MAHARIVVIIIAFFIAEDVIHPSVHALFGPNLTSDLSLPLL